MNCNKGELSIVSG